MFWKISQLDPEQRSQLAAISRGQGLRRPNVYFKTNHNPRLLATLALASLAVALGGTILAFRFWIQGGLAGDFNDLAWPALAVAVFAIYGVVCLMACSCSITNPIKPFVLVTPAAILKVGLPQGHLQGHRLRDATHFEKAIEYSGSQNYNGIAYNFSFPEGRFRLKEKNRERLQQLETVLNEAKAGGAKTDEPLLPAGGWPKPPFFAPCLDPFSQFWISIGVIGCVISIILLSF